MTFGDAALSETSLGEGTRRTAEHSARRDQTGTIVGASYDYLSGTWWRAVAECCWSLAVLKQRVSNTP